MTELDHQILQSIKKHCEDIRDFTDRCEYFDVFANDNLYYNAVTMSLMQIGVFTRYLSEDFKESSKDVIPWETFKSFRDVTVKSFYDVLDRNAIWDIAVKDVDVLYKFCIDHLKILESDNLR